MFNTGFLPSNSNAIRIEQGLPPENFANNCAWTRNGKSSGLAGDPIKMYPSPVTALPTYGFKPLPTNCPRWKFAPCTQFVQPP